jgi:hypothetical protein
MPRENTVLCAHCGEYLSRKREREHRRLAFVPVAPPPLARPSRLRRIVAIDTDSDDGEQALHGADEPEDIDVSINGIADEGAENEDIMMQDPDMDGDHDVLEAGSVVHDNADKDCISGAVGAVLLRRWGTVASSWPHQNDPESDSDTESESEPPCPRLEDGDGECDFFDWKAIEEEYGLSAWDQLGESYEAEAAAIGMFSAIELTILSNPLTSACS